MVVAVAISMGLMLLFQQVIAPHVWPTEERPAGQPAPEPPAEKPAPESPAPETPGPGSITLELPSSEAPAPEAPAPEAPVPAVAKAPELEAVGATGAAPENLLMGSARYWSDYNLEVHVTPRGGAVQRLSLARDRFFKTVADRGKKNPDDRLAMDLVEESAPFPAFLIPELRVWFAGADGPSRVDLSEVVWRVEKSGPTEVVLSVEVHKAGGTPALRVVRRYTLRPRGAAWEGAAPETEEPGSVAASVDYEIGMSLEFAALADEVERVDYVLGGPAAIAREDARSDFRAAVAGAWTDKGVEVQSVAGAKLEKKKGEEAAGPAKASLAGPKAVWAGETEKYFAVLIIPQKPSREGTFAAGAEAFRYEVTEFDATVPLAGVRLVAREQAISRQEGLRHEYVIYAGPKDPKVLEAYAAIGLPGLIAGQCFIPGISEISRVMVIVLDAFHGLVRNYGLAIVMLVVVLRLALHPVTRWSQKSMSKMQTLGPKMEELRKKHGDKKEQLNQEMMKLYREEGINPVTSCLPMFLQMPIWIGLYGALQMAINLRHAAFLPAGWVDWMPWRTIFLQDLAQPDSLVLWSTPLFLPGRDIPLLGWLIDSIQNMMGGGITSFNLLPLLMAFAMYLQQRFTPAPSTGPQAKQQKQMMVFMTAFLLVVLYSAPAGLCLYILTSSLLGFCEQRYLKKKFVAAAAAAVAAKPGEPSPPKPPKKAGSLVAGRNKSIAERIEAWLKRHRSGGEK
jgi:YidC/Oxa1 family membrane protein insertase